MDFTIIKLILFTVVIVATQFVTQMAIDSVKKRHEKKENERMYHLHVNDIFIGTMSRAECDKRYETQTYESHKTAGCDRKTGTYWIHSDPHKNTKGAENA